MGWMPISGDGLISKGNYDLRLTSYKLQVTSYK
jgi:hypothetical protein